MGNSTDGEGASRAEKWNRLKRFFNKTSSDGETDGQKFDRLKRFIDGLKKLHGSKRGDGAEGGSKPETPAKPEIPGEKASLLSRDMQVMLDAADELHEYDIAEAEEWFRKKNKNSA